MAEVEEWRPIVGLSGYEVSNLGRVLSTRGSQRRILSGGRGTKYGHRKYSLWSDGRQVGIWGHRAVLEAFIGPPGPGQVARHLDGDATNNKLANLHWGTPAENGADTAAHGRQKGELNPSSRLTEEDVWAIHALKDVVSADYAARRFGVSKWSVLHVWSGRTWGWLSEDTGGAGSVVIRKDVPNRGVDQVRAGDNARRGPVPTGAGDRQGGSHSGASWIGGGTGAGS